VLGAAGAGAGERPAVHGSGNSAPTAASNWKIAAHKDAMR